MSPFDRQGVAPSDMMAMRELFDANGWNRNQHAFHYAPASDRWELFRVVGLAAESNSANVTRVAFYDLINGWVAI